MAAKASVIGGFNYNGYWYWSSTQDTNNQAYEEYISTGIQTGHNLKLKQLVNMYELFGLFKLLV